MSTRQKSFFDQDKKPKYFKGPWKPPRNTNTSIPPHPSRPEAPQRQAGTGPPIKPCAKTMTKLKAFKFIEGAPTLEPSKIAQEDKENALAEIQQKKTPKASKMVAGTEHKDSKTTFVPPSTPAARLPLADLVGNADEPLRQASKPVSPDEQILWRGSQPVNTPLPRKGRKRARSSSPVAASQEEIRLDSVKNDLTTPQADPATELWNKYTSNKGTPTTNKGVTFAHLINESSPRSSSTAGDVSGLRRWASCGIEFPTSAKKRRRINGAFRANDSKTEDVFVAPSSDGLAQTRQKESKLASIVQRMQESARSQPRTKLCSSDQPSSSSPLPGPGHQDQSIESPLRHRTRARMANEEDVPTGKRQSPTSSDEFCDPDFDTEMVEALEISQRDLEPHVDTETPSDQVQAAAVAPPVPNMLPIVAVSEDSDDEFGVDDDDMFAADMEHVASLYDTRPEESGKQSDELAETKAGIPPVINLVDDDDDFGDDSIDADEFAAAEMAATQAQVSNSPQDTRAIQRYLVKRVDQDVYTTERGYQMPQKVLLVEEESTKLFKAITLRQSWFDTPCTPGAYVHVIGQFSPTGECLIDDNRNMLILHPDHLISSTTVADSFSCRRLAVLQARVKATSKANPPMLYGTLLHELFQEAMTANQWDSEFLSQVIDRLLPKKFETILEINSTCEQVKEHLYSKLPELQSWARLFVRAKPDSEAVVHERNGKQSVMSVSKLLDVEEHVWSPMYGLKGNIDATVQVTMYDDDGERNLTVPFEVKTGKNTSNANHVAQTALYNLLISNRYDVDVAYGILYYLETSDTIRIPAIRNEIMHMIIMRNELACYVRDRIDLPSMLKEDHKCVKCYAQDACFLYDKLVEDGSGESLNKKAKEKYDELVKPLKPSDQEFMKKWDSLLTKEESVMMRFRRELWTMLSTEREKLGRCFSNVIMEPGSSHEEKNGQKINRYIYTFIKQQARPGFSFTESQLTVGEPVVVSDEKGHFALANGYVTNVRRRRITVAVDRRLHNARTQLPGFDAKCNQSFAGIMEVEKANEAHAEIKDEPVLYRLDKDEFSNGMAAARNNLIQIMDNSVFKARDLRSLIVDLRAPVFNPLPNSAIPATQTSEMSMNGDQKAAIAKTMSANDYALVLGMPGTGKTTTIAHIIRALVAKGKSVLLTSYTHTAVDNILLKIRNDNIGILRLGAAAKIHPDVQLFATVAAEPKDSIEELEKTWMDNPVVATTCLTINHPLFSRRIFDYCIVDEASQITLPVCLGPIRMASKFILVGDHYQLPPLVQNKEAAEGGLDVSLFKLLCEAHPQAVVHLEHQYRMCADIMLLSNTFIYSGRLKCGTPAVASRQLHLPNPNGLMKHHRHPSRAVFDGACLGPETSSCWLSRALHPSNPVVFINTDLISTSLETQAGPRITNTLEARLVTHLTVSLLSSGISASEIGVIALYRSQLALLRQSLSSAHTQTQSSELAGPVMASTGTVELHTADKFQGRDKEVVIVSSVRSNENGLVGDLLKDARRVNVALTRARSKLVILGSEKTLSENELLAEIIALCRGKGWIIDLQQHMVDAHAFEESVTQTGTLSARSEAVPHSPSPSPNNLRTALGDVTMGGQANVRPQKRASQKTPGSSPDKLKAGRRVPGKVFTAGKKGILDGRPVLRDVFSGAI